MDPALKALLGELTGQPELWENIEASLSLESEIDTDSVEDPRAGEEATMNMGCPATADDDWKSNPDIHFADGDDQWETGSADMIYGHHNVDDEITPSSRTYTGKGGQKADQTILEPSVAMRNASTSESLSWKETGLKLGDVSGEREEFCPWRLVTHYPDIFVGKENGEKCRPLFALDALHKNRVWDLYYIHHPRELSKDPFLFVPTYQFEHLLDAINAKLGIHLTIPGGANSKKFKRSFGLGDTPRPRFLGRSTSEDIFCDLTEDFPPLNPDDNLEKATHLGREEFFQVLESIGKMQTKKKNSEKSRVKRIKNHRAWGRQIKRVQRYLGLRRGKGHMGAPLPKSSASQTLDLSRPLSIQPEGSVLLVAIDIEAYEFNQELVTEVGVAVLDTGKLVGVAPGYGGQDWFSLIDARHFLIKENTWAVNKTHVHGCPGLFSFGESEIVPLADVSSMLEDIIDKATLPNSENATSIGDRPVVLVFHESAADIKYLNTLGYNLYCARNVAEIIDTRMLNSYNTHNNNSTSLEKVLWRLEIPCQNLHNAGNDAAYTLRAMIGLAVERRLQSLKTGGKEEVQTHIPFGEFNRNEGWSSGGEDSDGGDPVRPCPDFNDFSFQNQRQGGYW